jgi:ubiquinol-cytochrome c reductase iron-sulfur subunit
VTQTSDQHGGAAPGDAGGDLARRQEAQGSVERRFADPGLPAHVHRRSDVDPKAARRAERQVAAMFALSVIGTVIFVGGILFIDVNDPESAGISTKVLAVGMGLALFSLGAGAVHWAKVLMPDEEVVQKRKPLRATDEERADAVATIVDGGGSSGIGRRPLIRNSLIGALAALPLMAVVSLRDLWRGEGTPAEVLKETAWVPGARLVTDGPASQPILAANIRIGEVLHVQPEGIDELSHPLDEKAKSAVLLIRLEPEELQRRPERAGWDYDGIVAFSKICTHAGCPVALYEQTTHHLLCPCHQSTFDVTQYCDVVFGPATRALPQLAITVDAEGYLVAQDDFTEYVGPVYWERG